MNERKIEGIREELENELTWRLTEYNLLKRQLIRIGSEVDKMIYRKSLVVMLYAYYEGFCSFAFNTYILAINEENLLRKDAHWNLVAASLHQEFTLFESDEYKEDRFKRIFKKRVEDTKLYKQSKRVYLLEQLDGFLNEVVTIPDKVVNTESNLWPIVLKKLLYSLGLPVNSFVRYEKDIKDLVDKRNNIAHGNHKDGIDQSSLDLYEKSAIDVMNHLIRLITQSMKDKVYLKA